MGPRVPAQRGQVGDLPLQHGTVPRRGGSVTRPGASAGGYPHPMTLPLPVYPTQPPHRLDAPLGNAIGRDVGRHALFA